MCWSIGSAPICWCVERRWRVCPFSLRRGKPELAIRLWAGTKNPNSFHVFLQSRGGARLQAGDRLAGHVLAAREVAAALGGVVARVCSAESFVRRHRLCQRRIGREAVAGELKSGHPRAGSGRLPPAGRFLAGLWPLRRRRPITGDFQVLLDPSIRRPDIHGGIARARRAAA